MVDQSEPCKLQSPREATNSTLQLSCDLTLSEAVLRATLDAIEDGLLIVSASGRISHYNKRFLEIWSVPSEVVVSKEDEGLLAHVAAQILDPAGFKEDVRRLYASQETQHDNLHLKDGRIIQRLTSPLVIPGEENERMWLFRDITEARRAQASLQASQELLNESQRTAHIGSWELDLATGRLTFTDESYRVHGYAPGAFDPSLVTLFACMVPEDQPQARTHYQATLETGVFEPLEYRITRPDGAVRWLHVTGAVKNGADGRPVAFYGTQQDITALRDVQEDRIRLERSAFHSQKLDSLGMLAGGFAHDFNNLLTGILANVCEALEAVPAGSSEATRLEQAREASLCAADLCRQILAFSGRGRFVVAPHDLNTMVLDIAKILAASLPKKVDLELELAPGLPAVLADAAQVHQVVMNLVLNGADAIGPREGLIRLTTALRDCDRDVLASAWQAENLPEGPYVVLEVVDTGCGMDAATKGQIFAPFFTTKPTGRGLGLAAVQGIMRGHKGAIHVYSEPGKGTSFKLFFPALPESLVAPLPGGRVGGGLQGTGTILLVDDEAILRDTIGAILRKLGYSPLEASDGAMALDLFRASQNEIRLVLLDLTMPKLDGRETFQAIRAMNDRVPILIMSGYSEQEVRGPFTGSRLNGFIQKPFTRATLCAKLAEFLGD